MKFDFQKKDDLNARVTISLGYEDYGATWEENIRQYTKKVAIKGFRAGKTPRSVMLKMYGRGILEETVMKMLNEKLFGYLDEQQIDYFGSPVLAGDADPYDFDPKLKQEYKFEFELGLKPDFKVQLHTDEVVNIVVPTVDQSALDEDMIRYRRVFGKTEFFTEGQIEENDSVELTIVRIGMDKPDEDPVPITIDLSELRGEANDVLPGKSINDQLEVELDKWMGVSREVAIRDTLQWEVDPSPDQPLMFRATITGIYKPQQTALTGEQLTKFTGQPMEDESEFRRMLEARETNALESRAMDMKKMAIRKRLVDGNAFDIPETFLIQWINRQREKKVIEGSREAKGFIRDTKWSLLLDKIAREKNLEVTEKDVQRQVTRWVVENVNYNQIDIRKFMKKLYDNEYFMSSMRENAMEEIVFNAMLPLYTFSEEKVDAKAFEKAFHDIHHVSFDHDHSHDHDHEHTHGEEKHSHTPHEHLHG
jgi:trigger factor